MPVTHGEVQIIVSTNDNAGRPMHDQHEAFEHRLSETFGGLTTLAGNGYWRTPDGVMQVEPATIYIVAVAEYGQLAKVAGLVREFLDSTDQQSAYVRYPTGGVEFVNRTGA